MHFEEEIDGSYTWRLLNDGLLFKKMFLNSFQGHDKWVLCIKYVTNSKA